MCQKIRVSVVEDNARLLQTLGVLLDGDPRTCCAGLCANARQALKTLADQPPDVVLMDLELPDTPGPELITRLRGLPGWRAEILVYTVHDSPEWLFPALQAGASGYLLKDTPLPELLDAIVHIFEGGAPMSSGIARLMLRSFQAKAPCASGSVRLSEREREVLELIVRGFTDKEIAAKLGIAPGTVGRHVHKIYAKLHVHCRAAAVAKYLGAQHS